MAILGLSMVALFIDVIQCSYLVSNLCLLVVSSLVCWG